MPTAATKTINFDLAHVHNFSLSIKRPHYTLRFWSKTLKMKLAKICSVPENPRSSRVAFSKNSHFTLMHNAPAVQTGL